MSSGNADRKSWEKRHPVLTAVIIGGTLIFGMLMIGVCFAGVSDEEANTAPQSESFERPAAWDPPPEETKTRDPAPTRSAQGSGFSAESLELRAAYEELLKVKDETWFHVYCIARAGPAYEWGEYMKAAGGVATIVEAGIVRGDLRQMAVEYCRSGGMETDYTRTLRDESMNQAWVNLSPLPTPNANVRIVEDRIYQPVSEQMADCVWGNPEVKEMFAEYIARSPDKEQFALLHEAALKTAEDTELWDSTVEILAMCGHEDVEHPAAAATTVIRPSPTIVARPTPTPTPVIGSGIQLAVTSMEQQAGVMDAGAVVEGRTVSLVLVVQPAVGPALAEQLGDMFVRMSKSLVGDDAPGKEIGRGRYDYLIGVYWLGEDDPIVQGAKSAGATRIRW